MLVLAAVAPCACGGTASTPQATLKAFLASWARGDWTAMRTLVSRPPADFTAVNAGTFAALGITTADFQTVGRLVQRGARARARVVEHFALAHVGGWSQTTTVDLAQRDGRWLITWTPATIAPALGAGDRLAIEADWPARAPILGADGASLTTQSPQVVVGIAGSRIKNASAVKADLLAAGATSAEVALAFAQARAHPDYFDPVFTVSKPRFEQLKTQPGPGNVYAVPGTEFQLTAARTAITPQLGAHLVGTVGPITAAELDELGAPYDAESIVGQDGLEAEYERRLAGTPTSRIVVLNDAGATLATLATFSGHPGEPVVTSIDPAIQRAAEAALAGERRNVAMVAMRASTGQILAVVSDPVNDAYDSALEGEYPPGSTFKVLTATALIRDGLSPGSPARCPSALTVDGETFHNAAGVQPTQTIDQAFTESCNTAFIGLTIAHLPAADFTAAARLFGLNRTPHPGVAAFGASIPAPTGQTALAATAIGQAGVVFSPLAMATVAAAIDGGTARAPRLVSGASDDGAAPTPLPANVVADLRLMMGHVVASGTAAGTGLPSGTHAKTGTAEYGPTGRLIDAWLMGYDGDIAFAIVVSNSGGIDGGPLDGPLIATFLKSIDTAAQ
ncbi:MAG: penicillin-binding transpeptidase domain-containing protein [Solirubrobacteraceae bacterium]